MKLCTVGDFTSTKSLVITYNVKPQLHNKFNTGYQGYFLEKYSRGRAECKILHKYLIFRVLSVSTMHFGHVAASLCVCIIDSMSVVVQHYIYLSIWGHHTPLHYVLKFYSN